MSETTNQASKNQARHNPRKRGGGRGPNGSNYPKRRFSRQNSNSKYPTKDSSNEKAVTPNENGEMKGAFGSPSAEKRPKNGTPAAPTLKRNDISNPSNTKKKNRT